MEKNQKRQLTPLSFITLTGVLLTLCSCNINTKPSPFGKEGTTQISNTYLTLGTDVVNQNTLLITIKPKKPDVDRFFSLSFHPAEESIAIPPKSPTQEDKDRSISLMFKEIDNGKLALLFYKKALISSTNNIDIYNNPFNSKMPFSSLDGKNIGTALVGVAVIMSKKSGKGVINAPLGNPILYDKDKGYQFLVHFNTPQTNWKVMIGEVRVNFFHPGLTNVLVSSTFCLKNCKKTIK